MKNEETLVRFMGWNCEIKQARYQQNKRLVMALIDIDDGASAAVATVNIPDADDKWFVNDEHVIIKDGSENAGIVHALLEAKVIVGEPVDLVQSGYAMFPIYKLHPDFKVNA